MSPSLPGRVEQVPSQILGKCSQPGCPNRTDRAGRCEDHRREADRQTKSRQTWRPYDDPRWVIVRELVLFEEPTCAGARCLRRSSVVDHVIPVRERPDLAFTRSNLQALCPPCHNRKTAAENSFGGTQQ